ncbi:MAG: PhnD/SsuA/transferrin family substrate-binding protein [Casimicrobiaceae bacterium]
MIANARMYAVTPAVAAYWRTLLAWVEAHADVELEYVDHRPPRPIDALWRRKDLGCAFMCGYPWATWSDPSPRPLLLAGLVSSPARYRNRSAYCTDIVVRADSTVTTLDDLRGRRFAFTTPSSQSGYQAPRALFAALRGDLARTKMGTMFEGVVGPLVTPRAVVDAIIAGDADAGPLDSYWHDLLRLHEPRTAARLRTIASTPLTPMPPLVAAAGMADADHRRLADALLAAGVTAELRETREALALARFAMPDPAEYAILVANARHADDLGYKVLQ